MLRATTAFILAVSATLACAQEVTLTRLSDCGTGGPRAVNERFSDTYAYGDRKIEFVFSCYLIKHGDDYMMWDTGQGMNAAADVRPKVSVVDQLAQLNVTPGHHSVLVKLKDKGNVILVGDAAHFHENYESNGVPVFNVNRADSLASMDRIKKLASAHKATVIIQHDARDVGKLPAFPAGAR